LQKKTCQPALISSTGMKIIGDKKIDEIDNNDFDGEI